MNKLLCVKRILRSIRLRTLAEIFRQRCSTLQAQVVVGSVHVDVDMLHDIMIDFTSLCVCARQQRACTRTHTTGVVSLTATATPANPLG